MQPVEPSTTVRGPAALTISFITKDDSQPWQVRWPEVKNSSSGSFLTPLNGSRPCVGRSLTSSANSLSVTAMTFLLWLLAQPDPSGRRLRFACCRGGNHVAHLLHVRHRDLAPAQAGDEADQRRPVRRRVQRRPHLGGQRSALVRRTE